MKKKICAAWLAIALAASVFSGCSVSFSTKTGADVNTDSEDELTAEEAELNTGISLKAPEDAEDVEYYSSDEDADDLIIEMVFTRKGITLYMAAESTNLTSVDSDTKEEDLLVTDELSEQADGKLIDVGFSTNWYEESEASVNGQNAIVMNGKEGTILSWVDKEHKLLCNLCCKEEMEADEITGIAESIGIELKE